MRTGSFRPSHAARVVREEGEWLTCTDIRVRLGSRRAVTLHTECSRRDDAAPDSAARLGPELFVGTVLPASTDVKEALMEF
ncbi:MAG: hypothetical protein HC933_13610 [Pleurocapsa sp. SU_196_0]|nr:hypothetical protein [Pleurocapsa sp. SU_196_0]